MPDSFKLSRVAVVLLSSPVESFIQRELITASKCDPPIPVAKRERPVTIPSWFSNLENRAPFRYLARASLSVRVPTSCPE
jgi:hypothetical protein